MDDPEQLKQATASTGATDDVRDDAAVPDDPLADEPELQQALHELYLKCTGEDRYPRLIEVKDVKQAEFYWGGRQYIWWSESSKSWNLPTQAPAASWGDLNLDDEPRFEYVTNIYQATGLTVIGAIAGAPPRYRFFPADADNTDDLETAEGRTKLAKLIQRWNPSQKLLQEETYHAWTGGFIAWWTRYVEDGERYGIDSVHLLSQGAAEVGSTIYCQNCGWSAPAEEAKPPIPCPQCGVPLTEENIQQEESIPVPEEGSEGEIAKGRQVISVFGALNCKRPQHTNEQSEWHYFAIEREIHYAILRGAFPEKANEIEPGMGFGADDVFERNARLSVSENTKLLTQTGAAQSALCTFAVIWFRPSAFWVIDDEEQREELLKLFPRGCRVEFCGRTYCTSEPESLDDAIVSAHAMPGRGQHRPAIGTSMLSVQDRFNTLTNITQETYEYGIPITYRDSLTFNSDADDDQRAAPGLEVEVFVPDGVDIRQKIMQVRADSVSPDMAKSTLDLMGPVTQYLSGTFPALTGAAQDQPDTLGQQAMQRDQAMGRMGVFYVNLKQAHADLMTISCRSLEAHMDGEVKIPVFGQTGDFESESVDITALEGEAEAYPEGDENFPELWNQQRATLMQIMDSSFGPILAQEPGNAELIVKLTGIPDLKVPKADAWRKQLKEISELTKLPQGDELLAGIAPMVDVDPVNDDNATELACCRWWLNNELGQKMKRQNPVGVEAVKEHAAKHAAAIPAPPQPEKPVSPSVTAALKDMPPEAQAQWLEKELGIKIGPEAFLQKVALDKASKPVPKPPVLPPQGVHEETHA